jgi:uncharacterized membrane protein
VFSQPFAVPALLLFIVALPLVIGAIPRNRVYGFRTRRTLSDDAVWYPVNRAAGIAIIIASALYFAATMIWPYNRAASDNFSVWLRHLAAFAVPLIIGLSVAGSYSKSLSASAD